jgi:hypothetical protein
VTAGLLRLALGAALLGIAAPLLFHPDGPPTAHTGGFGEPTCAECHTGETVNTPSGTLRLEGLPARWRPGGAYRVAVVMRRGSLARAGFELSARFADGTQAGALAPSDSVRVAITRDSVTGLPYAHHTRAGTRGWSGEARWLVTWLAPAAGGGEVVLHVASVASNDDDSNLGDFVFTAAATVRSRR